MSEARDRGMAARRAVLGDDYVDRAEAAGTELDAPFRALLAEGAWGTLWASDAITRRERSMLTVALLAALGNWDELRIHLRATRRTGASPSDVMQALMHVAIYAGVPRANRAVALAKEVLAEPAGEDGGTAP